MIDYEKIAEGVDPPGGGEASSPGPASGGLGEGASLPTARAPIYPLDHPKYQGLAAAKGYDQNGQRLVAVRYNHEAMIDMIIAEPSITQNKLAEVFGKSVPWISRIIGSDAFQAALAKRREELTDPFLIASIEERFKGVVSQSLDIIAEKLAASQNTDLALKALDVGVKALGYGARSGGGGGQHNQFIIQLPPKSENSQAWVDSHSPMKQAGSDSNA